MPREQVSIGIDGVYATGAALQAEAPHGVEESHEPTFYFNEINLRAYFVNSNLSCKV